MQYIIYIENAALVAGSIGSVAAFIYGVWKYIFKPIQTRWNIIEKTCNVVDKELGSKSNEDNESLRSKIIRMDVRLMLCEARTRAAMQLSKIAHWESDKHGRCIFASKDLCDLSGYSAEQIKGYGWINMIPHDMRKKVQIEWEKCVKEERDFSMNYAYTHPEKGIIPVHGDAFIVRDNKGKMLGLIGIATPI